MNQFGFPRTEVEVGLDSPSFLVYPGENMLGRAQADHYSLRYSAVTAS